MMLWNEIKRRYLGTDLPLLRAPAVYKGRKENIFMKKGKERKSLFWGQVHFSHASLRREKK